MDNTNLTIMEKYEMISQDENLYTFIHDKDEFIRAAVADQGYGLDILINDISPYVRAAVAMQGYGLDILINDPDPYV